MNGSSRPEDGAGAVSGAAAVGARFIERYHATAGQPHDMVGAVDELFAAYEQAKAFATDFQRTFVAEREKAAALEKALAAIEASHQRFKALVANASDAVAVLNGSFEVTFTTDSFEQVWGVPTEHAIGRSIFGLIDEDELPLQRALRRLLERPKAFDDFEITVAGIDGKRRHLHAVATNLLDAPAVEGIVLNARDVTFRKELEGRLQHQAMHDPLTNLPNRALFLDRVEQSLEKRARGESTGILFIDLDRFKSVNDTLGHGVGDALLINVAQVLQAAVRPHGATLARLSGDEFAVMVEGRNAGDLAYTVAESAHECLRVAVPALGHSVVVSATIGLAWTRAELDTAQALLRAADIALHEAKESAKGSTVAFSEALGSRWADRLELEQDLRHAVERGELRNLYQPIVSLTSGEVHCYEALVRWDHPTRGLIGPAQFVPIAEEAGLITAIGEWVLREACRFASRQQHASAERPASVSVNVSALQLREDSFPGVVATALKEAGVEPELLQLEITEGRLIEEGPLAVARLRELHELGVRLAIDDFGTGYSSLGYLAGLPIDVLKVDRSFVARLGADERVDTIVDSILQLAKGLHLGVVAEGIETREQYNLLATAGCAEGQGFFVSRPVSNEAALNYAAAQANERAA